MPSPTMSSVDNVGGWSTGSNSIILGGGLSICVAAGWNDSCDRGLAPARSIPLHHLIATFYTRGGVDIVPMISEPRRDSDNDKLNCMINRNRTSSSLWRQTLIGSSARPGLCDRVKETKLSSWRRIVCVVANLITDSKLLPLAYRYCITVLLQYNMKTADSHEGKSVNCTVFVSDTCIITQYWRAWPWNPLCSHMLLKTTGRPCVVCFRPFEVYSMQAAHKDYALTGLSTSFFDSSAFLIPCG